MFSNEYGIKFAGILQTKKKSRSFRKLNNSRNLVKYKEVQILHGNLSIFGQFICK